MPPIVAPIQSRFDGGEISPKVYGRVDNERYKTSLALCKNWIPPLQGNIDRRPGTEYIGTCKYSAPTRIFPFNYSNTDSYIIEMGYGSGAGYIRFYTNYGQVQVSGSAYEIGHPYAASEIFEINFVQSADVLYLVHPNHPPLMLQRYGPTNWQLVQMVCFDGPYISIIESGANNQGATLAASSTSGSVTVQPTTFWGVTGAANNGAGAIRLTFSGGLPFGLQSGAQMYVTGVGGTTEANGTWVITVVSGTQIDLVGSTFVHTYTSGGNLWPVLFASTDVGRMIRVECTDTSWGWLTITAYTNPYTVTATIQSTLTSTTFSAWAMGAWSETTGYPGAIGFAQGRLWFGKPPGGEQGFDASCSEAYQTFSPTPLAEAAAAPQDNNALSFLMDAEDVEQVVWINGVEQGVLIGTTASEWFVSPSTTAEAITPTNISAVRTTRWGSAAVQAVHVDRSTLFVERGAVKIRELDWYWDIQGFRATDLNEFAEHITPPGLTAVAYTRIPTPTVWFLRSDGVLLGMTYQRDLQQLQAAFHQHVLGGYADAAGSAPRIESITVIPDPTGVKDDLWMTVQRWIGGTRVRTIEYLTEIFLPSTLQQYAKHLDMSDTYDNPLALGIGGINNSNPAVVSCPGHGLVSGNVVRFDQVVGITDGVGGPSLVNGQTFPITYLSANTFSIPIDTTSATPYVTPEANTTDPNDTWGAVRQLVTVISGLTFAEGEVVWAYADGAIQGPFTVNNSGQIVLTTPAAVVTIGYVFNSDLQLLRLEAGARNGTSLGKKRRTQRCGVLLYRSQGLQMGTSFTSLDPVEFRTSGVTPDGQGPPLFSGILTQEMDFDYDFENQICFRVSNPEPCSISAVMPMLEVQDRA